MGFRSASLELLKRPEQQVKQGRDRAFDLLILFTYHRDWFFWSLHFPLSPYGLFGTIIKAHTGLTSIQWLFEIMTAGIFVDITQMSRMEAQRGWVECPGSQSGQKWRSKPKSARLQVWSFILLTQHPLMFCPELPVTGQDNGSLSNIDNFSASPSSVSTLLLPVSGLCPLQAFQSPPGFLVGRYSNMISGLFFPLKHDPWLMFTSLPAYSLSWGYTSVGITCSDAWALFEDTQPSCLYSYPPCTTQYLVTGEEPGFRIPSVQKTLIRWVTNRAHLALLMYQNFCGV